jgi:hypothetical protein
MSILTNQWRNSIILKNVMIRNIKQKSVRSMKIELLFELEKFEDAKGVTRSR